MYMILTIRRLIERIKYVVLIFYFRTNEREKMYYIVGFFFF